jgi:ubiquinone biosynthesis UbiH/UbiF/VisC/COQ6 family hydroxylase
VAVVGAGVVGLSAALGFAQRGVPVVLVGPAPAIAAADAAHFDARIYALSPGAVGLLEALRVWPQVAPARRTPVERMRIFGDDGGHLQFDAASAAGGAALPAPLATIVEESSLLRALWLGCTMSPGVRHVAQGFAALLPAAAASGPAADAGPGGARLVLADGSTIDAALLLGADGKRSAVRAAAGINVRASGYGQTAIVANLAVQRGHGGTAFQWFTDEGVVALLPLPGAQVSLVWSAPSHLVPALMALAPQQFAERLARRTGAPLGTMELAGERHEFVLDRLVVDRLVGPGVALLGDAAHVVHPLAGQGLNLGLQDVSELLRLADAREPWRALGDPVFLRRYERARAGPISLMRGTVDGLARLFGEPHGAVRRLRNVGLSAVDLLAPLKNALVRRAQG